MMTQLRNPQLHPPPVGIRSSPSNSAANKLAVDDRPVHSWYRFVLSFPPHLVRDYLAQFGIGPGQVILDPFCGTGTVLVECKKLGIDSIGIEAHPMVHAAAAVKTDWTPDPSRLIGDADRVAHLAAQRIRDAAWFPRQLPAESRQLLIGGSISPRPLRKTLILRDTITQDGAPDLRRHHLLALAAALPTEIGNLHFGPEVGARSPKSDAPVIALWIDRVDEMAAHLAMVEEMARSEAKVIRGDSRSIHTLLLPESVDAVITSPPYPNEKEYTRTTRLESVILQHITNRAELRNAKKDLIRSNTRGVYKTDDDDRYLDVLPEVCQIAEEIESRRLNLGKTSGFEKQYAKVAKLYFGGMVRHLAALRTALRQGASLAYVLGDQASYLQVMIRTGCLIAKAAERLGYEVVRTDLFRTRRATATRAQLREEVIVLRWTGKAENHCDGQFA